MKDNVSGFVNIQGNNKHKDKTEGKPENDENVIRQWLFQYYFSLDLKKSSENKVQKI